MYPGKNAARNRLFSKAIEREIRTYIRGRNKQVRAYGWDFTPEEYNPED